MRNGERVLRNFTSMHRLAQDHQRRLLLRQPIVPKKKPTRVHQRQEEPVNEKLVTEKPTSLMSDEVEDAVKSKAILNLLKHAFDREGTPYADGLTEIPKHHYYYALQQLSKQPDVKDRENNLYNDYIDRFYKNKTYKHRDDLLLQALMNIVENKS